MKDKILDVPKLQDKKKIKKKKIPDQRRKHSDSTKQTSIQHIPTLFYKGFLTVTGQESCLSSKQIGLNLLSS